ncbi:response regulator transcription factor [Bifidobacterium adolescentis]|uniref:response regulator transcription factor n=1 Tax=Bifidobacterium adolescentis TaxID=1680 RepID=UPI0011075229|nr:response regulator [Bifidobacterium adolescentis]MDB0643825.1 response regulator [Bifidobacterium adolescentis]
MTGKTVGGPKILLVDDDKIVVEALTDLFKRILPAVSIVDSATSGVEALELFASNADQYALVLLDMSLEGMQGPEVCRRMRLMDCSTPILGMTSFSLNRYRVPLAAAVSVRVTRCSSNKPSPVSFQDVSCPVLKLRWRLMRS